jgi:alpha-ribazole phosphatase
MITVWMVRHGETDWNQVRRFQGSSDTELNAIGRAQAAALAPRLAKQRFDAMYASDLTRVRQTAHLALNGDSDAVVYDARLRELGFGKWEGLTWDEIRTQYPDEFASWENDRSTNPHGGDSLEDVRKRVESFLTDLRNRHLQDQHVLVFAHGGVMAVMLSVLLGSNPAQWWQFRFQNCAVTQVELYTRGVILARFNDESHIVS